MTVMSVVAPMQATVVALEVVAGDRVRAGQTIAVLESMKMEHLVVAEVAGEVVDVAVAVGDTVRAGEVLVSVDPSLVDDDAPQDADVDHSIPDRADLAAVEARHELGRDAARPDAVGRRHARGQRTARENLADLVDRGTFVEYGPLAVAAQRRRRDLDDLIRNTPADGLVGGVARIDGHPVVVASYDYMVLAGTQGYQNHRKKDRLFALAERQRLPLVLLAEGGGGRPGDVDAPGVSGLDCLAFQLFAELSGAVPLVGIASGRCFAGNAALLGCCDVVIATQGSSIGMGGPAMIEGGGLGVYDPDEIGPLSVQVANGVVDVAVADEAEAVAVARRYLAYFAGPIAAWECAEQTTLRHVVPEDRVRVYDVRAALRGLVDIDSVLELRRGFGAGMVTALARIEGRPLGVVANDPTHLGGAIDPEGADKASRFLQLCDAFALPVLFLCDTPGFMVGPDVEAEAQVRHAARLFVTGANLSVPFGTVILRKGYGLGAQAMAGGSFKAPLFCVAWPTGELGGMGLEGAVRLGFRKELESAPLDQRDQLFADLVARAYEHGKAMNAASHFEIDDVIDPADTRRWITTTFWPDGGQTRTRPRSSKTRPNIDTW
jgi:acetyl-CoA carboxylase carboxyltransferase component